MGKLKIDYKEGWFNAQKYIEQLEQKLEQTEKDLVDYQFNFQKIKELEQEKAKLINKVFEIGQHLELTEKEWLKDTVKLAQAKEIIKEFVCHYNNKTIYVNNVKPLLEQAEQFLKE